MNAQLALIPVLSTAPTPLDHTHVAVTQATNSMKMDFYVMVSFGYQLMHDGNSVGEAHCCSKSSVSVSMLSLLRTASQS